MRHGDEPDDEGVWGGDALADAVRSVRSTTGKTQDDVAPVYLLSTVFQTFGHLLDGQSRLPFLTAAHLRTEAGTWGLTDPEVRETIARVAAHVRDALPTCAGDGIDVSEIADLVDGRAVAALAAVT